MPAAAHMLVLVAVDSFEDVVDRRAHILNLISFTIHNEVLVRQDVIVRHVWLFCLRATH